MLLPSQPYKARGGYSVPKNFWACPLRHTGVLALAREAVASFRQSLLLTPPRKDDRAYAASWTSSANFLRP